MAITRLQRFREVLAEQNLDGMLISTPENRRYLSGFTGSSGVLLISETQAFIVTDFRYWEQVALEVGDFELSKQGPVLWRSVIELVEALKWQKIGFEASNLTFHEYQTLSGSASSGLQFTPTTDLVEQLRWVKEPVEMEILSRATEITDLALQKTLNVIKPGVTEEAIALEFDYQLRAGGAEGSAFTTIIASGERAALPHGAASGKPVATGDLVIIDGGALYKGYHGDLTRTVVIGKATSRQQEIYHIVLQAQEKALAFLKAGLAGNVVDSVAREFIAGQGYGEYFGHGLGHSVGLNIHESPRLSITEQSVIPAGAVITVEPGIYLPGWGGVRIEDLVVVGENGVRNLTGSPKGSLVEI